MPNKPAKVGIWHYQGTVRLSNGEPCLVYTRVHDTASNMGESTQTASIVLLWADLVQKFNQPTVICRDSYYVGRQLLEDGGVRYIAAALPRHPTTCVGMMPIYDEDKAMFSGCDIFNRQLHNRTFPYAPPRNTNMTVGRIFVHFCADQHMNGWKAVLKQRDSDCPPPEFMEVCDQLAIDIAFYTAIQDLGFLERHKRNRQVGVDPGGVNAV